jgi:hypothetical protein
MATVNTSWTSPASATLDKATGATIDETMTDAWSSNLYHLGGTQGYIGSRAYNNANISLSTAVATLTFNSGRHEHDPNGVIHSDVTNNSRMTCRTTGLYHIGASVEFAANATGYRLLQIILNGATTIAIQTCQAVTNGDPTRMTIYAVYPLNATDYVEVQAYQTSGGALNVVYANAYSPDFWITKA